MELGYSQKKFEKFIERARETDAKLYVKAGTHEDWDSYEREYCVFLKAGKKEFTWSINSIPKGYTKTEDIEARKKWLSDAIHATYEVEKHFSEIQIDVIIDDNAFPDVTKDNIREAINSLEELIK